MATKTVARAQPDGTFRLFGLKWFTSAVDASVAVALARIEDPKSGAVASGTRGLSCFLVSVKDEQGACGRACLRACMRMCVHAFGARA